MQQLWISEKMARKILTKRWAMLVMLKLFTLVDTDCPTNLHKLRNTSYFLSNDQVDSNVAEERCSSMGGNLAIIESKNTLNNLISYFKQMYTDDLQTVWVYKYGSNYKYARRSSVYYGSSDETFPSFKAYKSAKTGYRKPMIFCKADRRYNIWAGSYYIKWKVQKSGCESSFGWDYDFTVYVGNEGAPGTKPLYRYRNSALSIKMSLMDKPVAPFTKRYPPFYIPDINIYIGIRSDVNETDWHRSDLATATYPGILPIIRKDICKQIALHYNDINWIPTAMDCGTKPAYYVCQIQFAIKVETIKCNSTSLRISWNPDLYRNIASSQDRLKVVIETMGSSYQALLSNAEIIIGNLMQRTAYTILARIYSTQCASFELSTTARARTGHGIPDPTTDAFIQSSPESETCVIGWKHNCNDRNITGFEIVANSSSNSTIIKFDASEICKTYLNQTVSLVVPKYIIMGHGINSNVTFQIQPHNCEGQGRLTLVKGYCIYSPPVMSANDAEERFYLQPATIAIAAAVIAAIPLIIGIFVYKRYKQHSRLTTMTNKANFKLPEDSFYENTNFKNDVIPVQNLEKTYMKLHASGFKKLKDEFETIKNKSSAKPHEASQLIENKKKNRYKNIYPFDDSRVVLAGNESNDYINAAFIEGYNAPRKFIATQGPKKCTTVDFWQMVWEQNCQLIVMLCKLREGNKDKCAFYWAAPGATVRHGSFTIANSIEENLSGIIKRTFLVSSQNSQDQRQIVQFQFTSWPDHSVPKTSSSMMYLRRFVREASLKKRPIIIHCSAGAGRSGTFIAMDILFDELDDRKEVNVVRTVLKMRERRRDMVQTPNQYIYLHKLLVEKEVLPKTDFMTSEFLTLMEQNGWEQRVEREYNYLSRIPNIVSGGMPNLKNGQAKTKGETITEKSSDNNNLFIEENIIGTQGPKQEKQDEFWNLMIQNHVNIVVALENLQADNILRATAAGEVKGFTNTDMSIILHQINKTGNYTERQLSIASKSDAFSQRSLIHLHVENWKNNLTPHDTSSLADVINEVQLESKNSIILVYCRNGYTRTSTFIALMKLMNRMKTENRIDIFRTVKDLRDIKPNMMDKLILYKFCHTFMKEYSSTFATYANL